MEAERFIGASCVLKCDGGLILEVQKKHKWRRDSGGQIYIGIGCIGGGIEAGESVLEALQREAMEEIGCRIHLRSAKSTLAITPDFQVHNCEWILDGPKPALIWEYIAPGHVPGFKVASFVGKPQRRPEPHDLPAIFVMGLSQLLRIGSETVTIGEIINDGSTLIQREEIPLNARLELAGTPRFLRYVFLNHPDIWQYELEALIGSLSG